MHVRGDGMEAEIVKTIVSVKTIFCLMQGYSAHLALPQPSVSDADAVSLLKADSISITKTTNDIACVRLHHRHSLPTVVLVDR